jgi:2-dehydropantoate 2-reductase
MDVELVEPESSHEPVSLSRGLDSIETSSPSAENVERSSEPIRHLIVSVRASQTVDALLPIRDRLDRASAVLVLQNGLGSVAEVAEKLFPALETRPQFMQGIVLPGGWMPEPFVVRHAALGNIPMGIVPRRGGRTALSLTSDAMIENAADSTRYLIETLSRAPIIAAEVVQYTELFQRQLEKLVINVVANPLTAILNKSNNVFDEPALRPLIRSLVEETASIIRALPELRGVHGVEDRFRARKLEERVMSYLGQAKGNTTSMCQHLRARKKTEIDYINGYLVKRAQEMNVPCGINAMLVQLILTKEAVQTRVKAE